MNESILIRGGNSLFGSVTLRGAKNAVLPLLAASILTEDAVQIDNCPYISDVDAMLELLRSVGADVAREDRRVRVSGSAKCACAEESVSHVMRSSMLCSGRL